MTPENADLVMRFLDGELAPSAEAEALRRIAEDEEARDLLRSDWQLRESFTGLPRLSAVLVPAGFTDRVMEAIRFEEQFARRPAAAFPLAARLRAIWERLMEPQVLVLRPAFALALLLVLAAPALLLVERGGTPAAPAQPAADPALAEAGIGLTAGPGAETVWVRFMFVSENAATVAVAGDFSTWQPIPLNAQVVDGQAVWSGLVPVTRGEHRYMFVVDGSEWVPDPLAHVYRDDGFGNRNAVLRL